MSTIVPAKTISFHTLRIGPRLLPRSYHKNTSSILCACDVSEVGLGSASSSSQSQQYRTLSSISQHSISEQSRPRTSPSIGTPPPTYSAIRTKMTLPFEQPNPGETYTSPYSNFFANVEAGRTTLGTTQEIEQKAFELQEQRLECGILESNLRFTTRSYGRFALPPYVSPGEHRVTVKVALSDIPFENDHERDIFMEIVGPRYNPKKGDLQLSSEKFASRIENKRYLVDMIEKIVANSRQLAKEFNGSTSEGSTSD